MHFTNSAEEVRIGWRVISEFLPQPSCRPDGVAFAAGFCNRPAAIALNVSHSARSTDSI